MLTRRPKGFSIATAMGLVALLTFLAAAMVSLFLSGLNFSQTSLNGRMALAQAEAGLSQVVYQLNADPDLKYGQNKEELHASVLSDYSSRESFYHVSFDPGSPYAHSTSNVDEAHSNGYRGRTVPPKCVHIFSTGYCRGQWRTIEAVVRRPPCPVALGSSGSIHSKTPLTVLGLSTIPQFQSNQFDRPGHLIANGAGGIQIDPDPSGQQATKVTGFIKSVGAISVAQPAEVWGGLKPHSSPTELPQFDIQAFDPGKDGMKGVVDILEETHGSQEMDVIYRCNHNLTFEGPVKMHDAFLYVKGDLFIRGGVSGRGAIVVEGKVHIDNGCALEGSNNVAILSEKEIVLRGASNYFQGILYSRKKVDARNITVLGSMLVQNPDPQAVGIELDHVQVVSWEGAGNLSYTTKYYDQSNLRQNAQGAANFIKIRPLDGGTWAETAIEPNLGQESIDKLSWSLRGGAQVLQLGDAVAQANQLIQASSPTTFLGTMGAWPAGAPSLSPVEAAFARLKTAAQEVVDKQNWDKSTPAKDQDGQQAFNNAKSALESALEAYKNATDSFAKSYFEFVNSHSDAGGPFALRPGANPTDGTKDFVFDLNRYVANSDRLQQTYWRVYNEKL